MFQLYRNRQGFIDEAVSISMICRYLNFHKTQQFL